jgi:hypothetical protein
MVPMSASSTGRPDHAEINRSSSVLQHTRCLIMLLLPNSGIFNKVSFSRLRDATKARSGTWSWGDTTHSQRVRTQPRTPSPSRYSPSRSSSPASVLWGLMRKTSSRSLVQYPICIPGKSCPLRSLETLPCRAAAGL